MPTLLEVVDHLLGGPGAEQQPDRPLTDIEQSLLRHLLTRMLRELSYALEPLGRVTPELASLESNPSFVQAAAPTDPVVVARMELDARRPRRARSRSACPTRCSRRRWSA